MADSKANNPNIDPANLDTLAGAFRSVFSQLLKNTDGMLPARVIKYDRDTNKVQVEVLIAMIATSGQQVSRAQIANIPVINIGGGGFIINFPIKAGNLGFIMANDRDISLFLQSFKEAPPNTNRVKNFADSVFIPSVLTDYTIDGTDTDNMVIQNLDGTVKISLSSDTITLKAPTEIKIDSPLTTVTGELVVEGLTRTTAGLAVTGIATTIYALWSGGNIYVVGNGDASGAWNPAIPPPPPP